MVELFLLEPKWEVDRDIESVKLIISLLNRLESVVWSLMTSGGRSEARLWLCNTVSGISSIRREQQRELFVKLLRSKRVSHSLASQLLQMIFEKKPHKAGHVLAKKSYRLEKFFEGNPRRVSQWFSSFSDSGGSGHQKGAKALSQFAFVNRDICWEELEWKGKHGQSPAMVATKPHYFLDLDVQRTVENFIDNVPEFWSSNEFSESVKDVINHRRRLLGFVHDDEYQEEKSTINDIMLQIRTALFKVNNLASIFGDCLKLNIIEAIKLLGMLSWVVYYRLSEECKTSESWESLFVSNDIKFRKSDKYVLLHYDGVSEESESDLDGRTSSRSRRKKKKRSKKKRRRDRDHEDSFDNELLDFDTSNSRLNLESKAVSWLLSTDGFSASWTNADLPEHLSTHCFATWMKWLVTKWNNIP